LLIGFMGAGKSSVGRLLARELGCDFLDLDIMVELRAGKPVAEIFRTLGEPAFRKLESEALEEVLSGEAVCIVALGGGAFIQAANRERIARSTGRVVFLEVDFEEALRRIGPTLSTRPLAANRELLEELFRQRAAVYAQAHFCADTTGRTVADVVAQLTAWVREQDR
jgi:shikimate kinase